MSFILKYLKRLFGITKINNDIKTLKLLLGKNLVSDINAKNSFKLNDNEFKVFSQFGEDGIIQFLINKTKTQKKNFIEFGVENYEEANTRFLLENDNWSGLVLDSDENHINYIKKQDYYWRYNLKAKKCLITKNNIDEAIKQSSLSDSLGLLSIDVDGNDYWIWEAINSCNPDIVIIEYNARFGPKRSVTIPYEEKFNRNMNTKSKICYGASLSALFKLGQKKGYDLVGTNQNGNNAFFVKKQIVIDRNLEKFTPEECFHYNTFSEIIDKNGNIVKNTESEIEILDKIDLVEI